MPEQHEMFENREEQQHNGGGLEMSKTDLVHGGLKVAEGLELPLSVVTLTQAILAKKGSGKTYTAAVIAEEMLTSGLPVTIIDPTGAWWGIKSSADGESAGYPVVVFGGDHADVAITPESGEVVALSLVERRYSA